jgi:hypothetical protein
LLFRALKRAAVTHAVVYISATGPFNLSERSFRARSVRIVSLSTRTAPAQTFHQISKGS